MRILFLSHYFPPEVNAPAARTFEHCSRWVRAGHQVTVVTCNPNFPRGIVYSGFRNRLWPRVENIQGIEVVRIWTYLAANEGRVRRIASFLSYLCSAVMVSICLPRPDVVVATSPQFFCGWAGVFTSWLKWRPLLLEIRDIWPESIRAVGALRNGPLLKILERMERWMYRSATHIVAVGSGYLDNILGKVDKLGAISVITNGVDLRRFVLARPEERLRRSWNMQGKFVCTYVGSIGLAHGLDVVLEAAEILKTKGRRDIGFCLVGDGAERIRLQDRARERGLAEIVTFTGQLPSEEIPAVLATSDACLVHLRGCELFGTVIPSKIFETMAMQRPIIMGVRGEARDIVMEAHAGIAMEPDSALSLVEAVESLADNPEPTKELGKFARKFVAAYYDRDVLADRYLRLLESVAATAPVVKAQRRILRVDALEKAEGANAAGSTVVCKDTVTELGRNQ
jgi:glycosyltransferase involved in cell wall biosynthesis